MDERAGMWLWDVLFAVAALGTAVLVATSAHPSAVDRAGAAGLVLGCALAWTAFGRRLATGPPGRYRVVYCAVLVAALVGAVALVPEANWASFVVLPQLFWLLELPYAIVASVVLAPLLPAVASLVHGEPFGAFLPQILFMSAFGVLVGIYIHRIAAQRAEQARLIEQLEASRAAVSELSHRAGVAAERERLAGEIHDTLAQGFTSIVTLLQAAQAEFDVDDPAARRHVELAVRSAKENLREARTLVAGPTAVATQPLADAVGRQVERLAEETGLDAAHGTSGCPRRLPAEHEVVLLRAAQELLANVARHAKAATVTVRLDFRDPHAVALTVADDGAGFDPADPLPDGAGGFGLTMMRTRVERLGGTFDLDTAPGAGTTATLLLPTEEVPA